MVSNTWSLQKRVQEKFGRRAKATSPSWISCYQLKTHSAVSQNWQRTWYLDSGASDHATNERNVFASYQDYTTFSTLVVGNDTMCEIVGSGSVTLQTTGGEYLTLQNVLYVPKMIKNLISIFRLLATQQYEVKSDATGCKLIKVSIWGLLPRQNKLKLFIAFNYSHRELYPLYMWGPARASARSVDSAMLWHSRPGYLHESKLLKLSSASSMYRHPVPKLGQLSFCESCAKEKLKAVILFTTLSPPSKWGVRIGTHLPLWSSIHSLSRWITVHYAIRGWQFFF